MLYKKLKKSVKQLFSESVTMFKVLIIALVIITLVSALRRPGNPSAKKVAASAPAIKPAPALVKKGVDFTWGGRPDPTPETRVDNSKSWLFANWRLGRGYIYKGAQQ